MPGSPLCSRARLAAFAVTALPSRSATTRSRAVCRRHSAVCASTSSLSGLSRRNLLDGAMGMALLAQFSRLPEAAVAADGEGAFKVPDSPYAYNALEPAIDERTMTRRCWGSCLACETRHCVLRCATTAVAISTTKQFFAGMHAPSSTVPAGSAVGAVIDQYGSLDAFKESFSAKATGLFGSGFVWLVKDRKGNLDIRAYANQDHPSMDADGVIPLIACDCWEHAYYLKYQNKRPEYIKAWWSVVDWAFVSKRFVLNMAIALVRCQSVSRGPCLTVLQTNYSSQKMVRVLTKQSSAETDPLIDGKAVNRQSAHSTVVDLGEDGNLCLREDVKE
eukprot:IDg2569t1